MAEKPVKLRAAWLDAPQSRELFALFASSGHAARFVGGCVRNALLGASVSDLDVATDASPQQVMQMLREAGFKAVGTGLSHGTVTAVVRGMVYEITTLRIDVETHGRHATVAFTTDWREDAARRDFTMNALYADIDGALFDPLGGYADLVHRKVRFIGAAEARIREDYLRILRFFRFSARYGAGPLDGAGLSACVRLRQGLQGLSAERVGAELLRLLLTPRVLEVLREMFAHGLLTEILGAAPHLSRLERWLALEARAGLQSCAMQRLGALCVLTEEDALRRRLRLSNRDAAALKLWGSGFVDFAAMDEPALRRARYRLRDDYQPLVAINWLRAGAGADNGLWRNAHALPDRWPSPVFPLKGADLIRAGMTPGPKIGGKLKQLHTLWLDSDFSMSKEELLQNP